jgi:aspartate-semialdehyde dehydrogenase
MKICILGATGLVGSELLDLIPRAWPDASLHLFASRDQTLKHGERAYEVLAAERLEEPSAPHGDLALVALDDHHSARYVPRLLELGYRVIDKSNTFRGDPDVPLAVAGVNCRRVDDDAYLVANPNCTTIPFTLAVAPLLRRWGLSSATVSTYQAISGAGKAALDDFLDKAATGHDARDRLGRPFDAGGYAANTVPHNGKTDDSGFSSEERKLMFESRKILEQPDFAISAQCCRVPVAVGHYENAWLTLGEAVETAAIAEQLSGSEAPFVDFSAGASGDGLSALATLERRDRVLVGRLRADPRDPEGRSFCLTVAADNLRLGAATNAVRVATRWFPSEDPELQAPG